jgi:hypothetical protein
MSESGRVETVGIFGIDIGGSSIAIELKQAETFWRFEGWTGLFRTLF